MKFIINALAGGLLFLAVGCGKDGGGNTNNDHAPLPRDEAPLDAGVVVSRPYFKYSHIFRTLGKKGVRPSKSDVSYTAYRIYRDPTLGTKSFNHQVFNKGLRTAQIEGIKVVLGGEDTHPAYELIKKTNDLYKLSINAHTLIVEDEVHVAQAQVEINAKKIVFRGNGKIVTTPMIKRELPGVKENGSDGLAGGSVKIFAQEVEAHTNFPVIVVDGADGQPAGPGIDGARGLNARIVAGSNYYYKKWKKKRCYGGIEGGCSYDTYDDKGRRSGNGQNAQRGGRPGQGGLAGKVEANPAVLEKVLISSRPGKAGRPDRVRKGGAPGNPATTCQLVYGKRRHCATAVKGKDAQPLITEEIEKQGEVIASERQPDLSKVVYHYNEYAKDLYLQRHVKDAQAEFEYALTLAGPMDFAVPSALRAYEEAKALLTNTKMRLSFFGHERTWAPKLSFAAAAKTFVQEGEKNLEAYFLAKTLKEDFLKNQLERGRLVQLREHLWTDIETSRDQITNEVARSANLSKTLADLKVAQEEFNLELRRLEKEIKRMAKRNMRVPFWEKAVTTISAISKSVPVGQPTFGAVGAGLDVVAKTMAQKYSVNDFISDVPGLADSFQDFDWKSATNELNGRLRSLDPAQFSKLETTKEKLAYLKEVGEFAKPIYEAVKGESDRWKEREVSKSAVQAEMDKIKRSHKVYQKTLKKLDALLAKKGEFLILAKALHNSIIAKLERINSNSVALAYAYDDIQALGAKFGEEFKRSVTALEENAKRRLEYYAYQLAKAFEYQYLSDFGTRVDLKGFYARAHDLFAQDADDELVMNKLKKLFEAEVSALVETMILKTEKRDTLVKTVELNANEVASLNRGDDIYLDFTELDFFGANKENIRLISIQLDEGSVFESFEGEMVFEHSGQSMVSKNGEMFFFTQSKKDHAKWISLAHYGDLYHSSPSQANGDELRSMLGLSDGTEVFSKAAGRGFVRVSSKGMRLQSATLRIKYSFQHSI